MVIESNNPEESQPSDESLPEDVPENTPESVPRSAPQKDPRCVAVRYGYMNHIGEFSYPPNMTFGFDDKVIIKTTRGIELGERLAITCSGCSGKIPREQMQTYARNSGADYYQKDSGRILRVATRDDLLEAAHLHEGTTEKLKFCQGHAERLNLPLKVVMCEHLFGGERVIFYFLAEGRVDFRSLVKELAVEYQTRIEMRQVGVRDEARLLADYETCGRECCCRVFLKTLRPVSMKMAKMQKATLDPSKVSGRCGRLKCCLRYEHVPYEELDKSLPKIGKRVGTPHGDGVVINRQIITQLVQVRTDGDTIVSVGVEDLCEAGPPMADRPQPDPSRAATDRGRGGAAARRGRPGGMRGRTPAKTIQPPKPTESQSPNEPPAKPADQPAADAAATEGEGGQLPRKRRRRRRRKRNPEGKNDSGGEQPKPPPPAAE